MQRLRRASLIRNRDRDRDGQQQSSLSEREEQLQFEVTGWPDEKRLVLEASDRYTVYADTCGRGWCVLGHIAALGVKLAQVGVKAVVRVGVTTETRAGGVKLGVEG
jgi:hypothetical protein